MVPMGIQGEGDEVSAPEVDTRTKEEKISPIVREFLGTSLGFLEHISDSPYCRLLINSDMIGMLLSLIEFNLAAARVIHNCIVKLETELGGDEEKANDIIASYLKHENSLQSAFFSEIGGQPLWAQKVAQCPQYAARLLPLQPVGLQLASCSFLCLWT